MTEPGLWVRLTQCLLLLLVVGVVLYDVVAIWRGGWDASVSAVVFTLSCKYPIVPFLAGLLCGHLFWPPGGGE